MEFTQDQIAAVIGQQQLEIIALRMEVARLRQYEPKPITPISSAPPPSNVTPIEAAQ